MALPLKTLSLLLLLIGTVLGAHNIAAQTESPLTSAAPGTVTLALTPAEQSANIASTFNVVIEVQAGEQQVDGVSAFIQFDPTRLEALEITLGTALPVEIQRVIDNSSGQIAVSAGKFPPPPYPSGTFTFATIQFRARSVPGTTDVVFETEPPRISAATFDGEDYTVETVNASVTLVGLTAVTDSAATPEDTSVVIPVLANDTDPTDQPPLTIVGVSQGEHGVVTVKDDNTLNYAPDRDYNGPDTFTYTVQNAGGLTATGTVNVEVTPVNDPPAPGDDSFSTPEDTPLTLFITDNDLDVDSPSLTLVSVQQPAHGLVTIKGANNIEYTPDPNFSGQDSFDYTISDGESTGTATVTGFVESVNDEPDAVNDESETTVNTPVTVDVLANDDDVDGDSLTISGVTQGTIGAVEINDDGTVTYTPNADVSGQDSFTYTISDGNGASDTALVTVTINNNAASLRVVVNVQGRSPAIGSSLVVMVNVRLTPEGESTPIFQGNLLTDENGVLQLDNLTPGTYALRLKPTIALSRVQTVTVTAGVNEIESTVLLGGDADGDNFIDILDFSILANAFGLTAGEPNFDERADFNGDTFIDILDFSILANNFILFGED